MFVLVCVWIVRNIVYTKTKMPFPNPINTSTALLTYSVFCVIFYIFSYAKTEIYSSAV